MIVELGHYALILAFAVAILQTIVPMVGAQKGWADWMAAAGPLASAQFALLAIAFAALTWAFVTSDFSVLLVVENSHTLKPLLYKISGVWGNHEGSLLLWVLILAVFGASASWFGGNLPASLQARVLAVQGSIGAAFMAFMIFTSNPFLRTALPPFDGNDLNPLLQDPGLAFHPPFLYLGYVGLSMAFSFAVAALIEGKVDAAWGRWVRPWTLAAWIFLTIGITLGSWWAYYELGWGGFWFWDPVENASFMPWLVGTALLHSALVVERRGALVVWTLLLAILTFSLSLVGTFLVRSGVLTSVHAFSSDPARGVGVLLLLVLSTGGALTLFAARAHRFNRPVLFSPVSREGGLVLNNIILLTAAGTVFLGTFYPLFVDMMSGDKISVGPPYFNRTFLPLMLPLLIAVVFGMNLRWKRDTLKASVRRGAWALLPVVAAMALSVVLGGTSKTFGAIGMAIGLWLVIGSFAWWVTRVNLFRAPLTRSLDLARTTPRALYGMVLAHMGLGFAVIGIAVVTAWQLETIRAIHPGEVIQIGSFDVRLDRVRGHLGPNYEAERAVFVVSKDGRNLGEMLSERRFYPTSGRQTTEAAIDSRFLSNLYLVIGDADPSGAWTVRAYWHPFVLLIWIGPLLMAFGGLVSLSDRRFRLGATIRSAPPQALVAKA